jgi:hypothetical protein
VEVDYTAPILAGSRWRSRGTAGHTHYTITVEKVSSGGNVVFRRERHRQGKSSGQFNSLAPDRFLRQFERLTAVDAAAPDQTAPAPPVEVAVPVLPAAIESGSPSDDRAERVADQLLGRGPRPERPRARPHSGAQAPLRETPLRETPRRETAETRRPPSGTTSPAQPAEPDPADTTPPPATPEGAASLPTMPESDDAAPATADPGPLPPREAETEMALAPPVAEPGAPRMTSPTSPAPVPASRTVEIAPPSSPDAVTRFFDGGAAIVAELDAELARREAERDAIDRAVAGLLAEKAVSQAATDRLLAQKAVITQSLELAVSLTTSSPSSSAPSTAAPGVPGPPDPALGGGGLVGMDRSAAPETVSPVGADAETEEALRRRRREEAAIAGAVEAVIAATPPKREWVRQRLLRDGEINVRIQAGGFGVWYGLSGPDAVKTLSTILGEMVTKGVAVRLAKGVYRPVAPEVAIGPAIERFNATALAVPPELRGPVAQRVADDAPRPS